jgi:acetyl-CoA carboxylase biotin carboxyl carrier protein
MAEDNVEDTGRQSKATGPLLQAQDLANLRELLGMCRENEIAELQIRHGGTRIYIRGRTFNAPPEYGIATPPAAVAPVPLPMAAAPLIAGAGAPAFPGGEAAMAAAAAQPEEATYVVIRSPMVGTFYRAPAPDAPSFVEVGDTVRESSVLCIIEAMKLMNEIKAETDGTIIKILAENGQPVEYNQPMFFIKPH